MNLNGPHLHLLVNHLPVAGSLGSTLLLLVALFVRSSAARRMALLALLLTGLATLPAYFTGEGAAHVVGRMPGSERARVHEHEEAAEFGLISGIAGGLIALGGLLATRRRDVPRGLVIAAFVVSLWATTVFARVALLGGEIRHVEIRNGFVPPPRPPAGVDSTSAQAGPRAERTAD